MSRFIVPDADNHRIIIRECSDLSYVTQFGEEGSGNDQLDTPFGCASDGIFLYVVDTYNCRIVKRRVSDLSYVAQVGSAGTGNDQFNYPLGACTYGGYLYVADTYNNRIVRRRCSDLSYVDKVGTQGSGDDQFDGPFDCSTDGKYLYVIDTSNYRLVKRNLSNLTYVAKIGTQGSGNDQFDLPTGCPTDGTAIYVIDQFNHRVVRRLCSDLSYVDEIGTQGSGDDQFEYPQGAGTDGTYLYIADTGNDRVVQRSCSDLSYVNKIGSSGDGDDQFAYPCHAEIIPSWPTGNLWLAGMGADLSQITEDSQEKIYGIGASFPPPLGLGHFMTTNNTAILSDGTLVSVGMILTDELATVASCTLLKDGLWSGREIIFPAYSGYPYSAATGVTVTEDDAIWVCGASWTAGYGDYAGWIYRYYDGAWTESFYDTGENFLCICSTDSTHIWAGGTDLRFYNGSSWSSLGSNTMMEIYASSESDLWGIIDTGDTIYKWNGSSWASDYNNSNLSFRCIGGLPFYPEVTEDPVVLVGGYNSDSGYGEIYAHTEFGWDLFDQGESGSSILGIGADGIIDEEDGPGILIVSVGEDWYAQLYTNLGPQGYTPLDLSYPQSGDDITGAHVRGLDGEFKVYLHTTLVTIDHADYDYDILNAAFTSLDIISAIEVVDSDTYYVGIANAGLAFSFLPAGTAFANGIFAKVQEGEVVYRTSLEMTIQDIEYISDSNIWVCGTNQFGTVYDVVGAYIYHYDGESWTKSYQADGNYQITDMLYFNSTDLWAVLANLTTNTGYLLHYNGSSWTEEEELTDFVPYSLDGPSNTDIYIGGYVDMEEGPGQLYHYNGTSASVVDDDTIPIFKVVYVDASNIWLAGIGAALYNGVSTTLKLEGMTELGVPFYYDLIPYGEGEIIVGGLYMDASPRKIWLPPLLFYSVSSLVNLTTDGGDSWSELKPLGPNPLPPTYSMDMYAPEETDLLSPATIDDFFMGTPQGSLISSIRRKEHVKWATIPSWNAYLGGLGSGRVRVYVRGGNRVGEDGLPDDTWTPWTEVESDEPFPSNVDYKLFYQYKVELYGLDTYLEWITFQEASEVEPEAPAEWDQPYSIFRYLDRSFWIMQPNLTIVNSRFRGVRESEKINQFNLAMSYDVARLFNGYENLVERLNNLIIAESSNGDIVPTGNLVVLNLDDEATNYTNWKDPHETDSEIDQVEQRLRDLEGG